MKPRSHMRTIAIGAMHVRTAVPTVRWFTYHVLVRRPPPQHREFRYSKAWSECSHNAPRWA